MTTITHRTVDLGGVRIHLAECGEGPVALMVHGFPESWYSWRHQLPALAEAGYRAVAMDVRGYGRSSKPARVEDYRMLNKVADVVGVVRALGSDDVTLIGHDWGAPIVWTSALLRPDLFRGVAGLSVPYTRPNRIRRPLETFRQMAGKEEFYIEVFQEPGRAEAEIEQDVRSWLLGFYWCISGDIVDGPNVGVTRMGGTLREKFVFPEQMPAWLTEADLDVYTREFEYSGFFGPLSRYRNVDRDWIDLQGWEGQPITIPALFIGGERDGPTIWGAPAIAEFPRSLPKLHASEILPGCGHWVQQERPEETNRLLLDFLAAIH
ncbi:MAG: alpha/beta hydrolase [Pseudomonadales bacterium]|jgi:pimeloyl-ACP methyl ester carboxylesterase|nr:alpha/beta hydrolase [Pseudomonadales bacterium]